MNNLIYQTYIIALPIILTALLGYIVWLLQEQKKQKGPKLPTPNEWKPAPSDWHGEKNGRIAGTALGPNGAINWPYANSVGCYIGLSGRIIWNNCV